MGNEVSGATTSIAGYSLPVIQQQYGELQLHGNLLFSPGMGPLAEPLGAEETPIPIVDISLKRV